MLTTSGKAATDAEEFLEACRVFLKDDFLPKLLYCLEELPEADIWWRPNEQSNSVGNLVLHLCGNMREWILNGIGGASIDRDRDAEFAAQGPVARAKLIEDIRSVVNEVDAVLAALPAGRLLQRHPAQSYTASCLQAIYHVVEHFSYHLGQILYIYKLRTGAVPQF